VFWHCLLTQSQDHSHEWLCHHSVCGLALAIYARYPRRMAGGWGRTYAIAAVFSLYLNVFVLIFQLFEKVPALHAMAPTQSEPPFLVAQTICMAVFILLGFLCAARSRVDALTQV